MNLKILGIIYQVQEVDYISKENLVLGQIDYINQTIQIDKSLSKEKKTQVLIHEILHGICEELGLDEINDNEQAIQGIACALSEIIPQITS